MHQASYRAERILVSGPPGGPGQAGTTWATLQYVLGLRRLGYEVTFIAPVPVGALSAGVALEKSTQADYFTQVVTAFGLRGCAALVLEGTTETVGLAYTQLLQRARASELLLNISGVLKDDALLSLVPRRAYVDLDPAFTQLWHAVEQVEMGFAAHTHFVTIGLEIGQATCAIPACGRSWIPTLQPIVLQHWPRHREIRYEALTTLANWRSYGSIWFEGQQYGQKAHALRPLFALPTLTQAQFLLALQIHPDEQGDLESLDRHGWRRVDPNVVAATPGSYRRFIQESRAEFGLAKSGYVLAQCGWFSDRSICYLASGRPVLAQETGFSRHLPTGLGLLSFQSLEAAVAQIEVLNADYARHARAARELAHDYFDSDQVLSRLLQRVGAA
jgi:hypothetical protein